LGSRRTAAGSPSAMMRPCAITTVIGPNGAGKSTVFKTVFGMLPARAGTITFDGGDVTNLTPRALIARGIDASRIVTQACPGLADTISEDREGTKSRAEIGKWVESAIAKMNDRDAPIVACLACTHYGYRKEMFASALGDAIVINPNESAVDDLFASTGNVHDVEVDFVTRYAIPQTTIDTLTWLLSDISRRTVDAMRNFVHVPDLF